MLVPTVYGIFVFAKCCYMMVDRLPHPHMLCVLECECVNVCDFLFIGCSIFILVVFFLLLLDLLVSISGGRVVLVPFALPLFLFFRRPDPTGLFICFASFKNSLAERGHRGYIIRLVGYLSMCHDQRWNVFQWQRSVAEQQFFVRVVSSRRR